MKAFMFYLVVVLTTILLVTAPSILWVLLGTINIIAIRWCKNHLSIKNIVKYSGYATYYKSLK